MLQYLINVTDNTFITAIISALIMTIMRINGLQLKRSATVGVLIGMVVALIYAILKRNTGYAVREFYDLTLLSTWVILILPTLILSWVCFVYQKKKQSHFVVTRLFNVATTLCLAVVVALFMPNLFLYPFEFGVGMESIFNTDYLYKCVGYWLAIMIMLIIAMFVYRVCKQLSNTFVVALVSLALVIFTIQNFITIAQILIVRRFIAYQQWLMDLVIFVLSHVNFFIFIFIIVSLVLAFVIYLKGKTTPLNGQNPAQIRRIKANIRRDRRASLVILAGVAITAYTITRARCIYEKGVEISPAEPITASNNGLILVPLDKVNDGNLHRFGYETHDGTIVRFIIIKKSENAYGVGLDACDICGASGYYQRGDQVVCSLCDVVMNIATIGFPGGCNPVPLKFDIIDGNMLIKPMHLEAEKHRFK